MKKGACVGIPASKWLMISFRTCKSALIHGDAAIGVSEAAKFSPKSDDENTRSMRHDELQDQDEGKDTTNICSNH